jgi:hypothetical protein
MPELPERQSTPELTERQSTPELPERQSTPELTERQSTPELPERQSNPELTDSTYFWPPQLFFWRQPFWSRIASGIPEFCGSQAS